MVSQYVTARRVRSEADDVAGLEVRTFDTGVVHVSTVGGFQIFQHRGGAAQGDLGVAAGNGRVRQDDGAGAVAADHHFAGQRVLLRGVGLGADERPVRSG